MKRARMFTAVIVMASTLSGCAGSGEKGSAPPPPEHGDRPGGAPEVAAAPIEDAVLAVVFGIDKTSEPPQLERLVRQFLEPGMGEQPGFGYYIYLVARNGNACRQVEIEKH